MSTPFTVNVAAKKSTQNDFVVFDFDLSGNNVAGVLENFAATAEAGGIAFKGDITLLPSSAAIFVETSSGFYGDFSRSFFLNNPSLAATDGSVGVSTMIGVTTKSTSITPGSILLAVFADAFDPNGNFLAQFYGVYPSIGVNLLKDGLPTLSGILDTIV